MDVRVLELLAHFLARNTHPNTLLRAKRTQHSKDADRTMGGGARDQTHAPELSLCAIERELVATRFTAIPIMVLIKRAHLRQPHK
jgi:hypothetical protein